MQAEWPPSVLDVLMSARISNQIETVPSLILTSMPRPLSRWNQCEPNDPHQSLMPEYPPRSTIKDQGFTLSYLDLNVSPLIKHAFWEITAWIKLPLLWPSRITVLFKFLERFWEASSLPSILFLHIFAIVFALFYPVLLTLDLPPHTLHACVSGQMLGFYT